MPAVCGDINQHWVKHADIIAQENGHSNLVRNDERITLLYRCVCVILKFRCNLGNGRLLTLDCLQLFLN
jgi:hypothetical protein